jgi:hypothetical protein
MPAGYLTTVLQEGANLSKGQQQRIALAQALLALGDDRKVEPRSSSPTGCRLCVISPTVSWSSRMAKSLKTAVTRS